jgi:nucleotide-binding universal stress UspA family protein
MFTRIVVPLDGSDLAEQALPQAEGLARLTGAPLRLIQVIDPHTMDHFGLDEFGRMAKLDQRVAQAHQTATEYLQQIARDLEARGLSVTTDVWHGDPARQIVTASEPGDLVVISTHGRDGAKRWFLGSVAESIARHAKIPVMLVRVQPPARQDESTRYADLLRQDTYRPEELADLLNIDAATVRQAALGGRLRAQLADHHVISITRADALSWLAERS